MDLIWPYRMLGIISLRTGDYVQAHAYFLEGYRLAVENVNMGQGELLPLLCETELRQGNLEQALAYCQDYIKLAYGTKTPFNVLERLEMVALVMKDVGQVEVTTFEGLFVGYVERTGAHAIIRGLRAISDFEHEFQMALINRKLAKHVETVFLMPSEEYSYLSSTIINDVAQHWHSI